MHGRVRSRTGDGGADKLDGEPELPLAVGAVVGEEVLQQQLASNLHARRRGSQRRVGDGTGTGLGRRGRGVAGAQLHGFGPRTASCCRAESEHRACRQPRAREARAAEMTRARLAATELLHHRGSTGEMCRPARGCCRGGLEDGGHGRLIVTDICMRVQKSSSALHVSSRM